MAQRTTSCLNAAHWIRKHGGRWACVDATTTPTASLLALMVLVPAPAEAQRRGVRVHAGGLHRTAAVRPVRAGYRPVVRRSVAVSRAAYYGRSYNRPAYYRPGVAAGVSAGTLAVGAAAASAPYHYGYSYPGYYPHEVAWGERRSRHAVMQCMPVAIMTPDRRPAVRHRRGAAGSIQAAAHK